MDVKQEAGVAGFLDPEIKMEEKENDSADSKEKVVEEALVFLKTPGRSCGDASQEVIQELKGETCGNWDTQLLEFLNSSWTPPSLEETSQQPEMKQSTEPKTAQIVSQGTADANMCHKELWVSPQQPHLFGDVEQDSSTHLNTRHLGKEIERTQSGNPAKAELQRQRFRMLSYKDASSPQEVCRQLQAYCRQWLEPERHTKEQMLELVTLEQFLAILPLDMQSWVKESGPETCAQAVTLAEEFLRRQPEGKIRELQVATLFEEPSANSPKAMKFLLGKEKLCILTEKECGYNGNENMSKGDRCLSENQERKPLVGRTVQMEQPTMYMKTDQESDLVYQEEKYANEDQRRTEGRNRESKAAGLDQLIKLQGVSEGNGLPATQEDKNGVKYDNSGGKCLFIVHQDLEGHEEVPYRCLHCSERFCSSVKLLNHERTHVGEELYICSCCGESERIHAGQKPRKCSHCGTTFGCNFQERIPGGEKYYTCSECGKSCSQRSDLLQHQRTHTVEPKKDQENDGESVERPREIKIEAEEESVEKQREIKREREEEDPPQTEEPRKKQRLMMEMRSKAAEAATAQIAKAATTAEVEDVAVDAMEEVVMVVVKTETTQEMSETNTANDQEQPQHEEDFGHTFGMAWRPQTSYLLHPLGSRNENTTSVRTESLKPQDHPQEPCRTSSDCLSSSAAKNLQVTPVKQKEYSGATGYEGLSDGVTAPKKAAETGKRKKAMILLEVKKEIIRKHEGGMRLTDLAKEYGRGASTISTILKMKEKITSRDAAKGVTRVSKQRPPVLEEVEKLLLLWIEEKQRAGEAVTEAIICEKAKALHTDLLDQQPGMSSSGDGFKASRGWVERFKTRSGIHSVVKHGEPPSSNVAAAEEFASEFLEVMVSEGYLPQQVFNCDETWLNWKRMPKCTFATEEETSLPGYKAMKDRLTLLFCANASGDLKIKPLLVYHSENPRAFKKHKVKKEQLSVLWRSSPRAWVTRLLFVQWVNLVFGPAVKKYLLDNNLPLKAVLLMDNAPAHPPSLKEDLLEEFKFITLVFLPPNITPLLQPMGQQVISSFKKLYTRELFQRCVEMRDRSSVTLHEFWRSHFDIVSSLQMITNAWAGVSQRNLNSAWHNLWPECVATPDSEASAPESTVLQEIVSLGRTIGLEVTGADVCEVVEEHGHELTTEDLLELQKETMEEQISFEEGDASEKHLYSREIKEACQMWAHLKTFVQLYHPDKALAQRLVNSFDTDIMSPFQGMLKRRQWPWTMEKSLLKQPSHEEEPASISVAQLPCSSSSSKKW